MKGIRYRAFALAALLAVLASMLPLSGRLGPIGPQPASAGNLSWEALNNLPSATGNVVPAAPAVMTKVVVSPSYGTDRTVFGINRTALPVGGIFTAATNAIWKSTDGGATWASLAVGTGLAAVATIVDIAISQNYGTDMALALALDEADPHAIPGDVPSSSSGAVTWPTADSALRLVPGNAARVFVGSPIQVQGSAWREVPPWKFVL